jgi:hypothetical protein
MARHEPGLTLSPSPQAVQLVLDRLHQAGLPYTQAEARSLVDAVLAIEGPRMQVITRGIVHGSLETIRQTAEVALSALREGLLQPPDLVGVVRGRLNAEPPPPQRQADSDEAELDEDDPRPVFKRRGR